jgi:hypothetical protein
MHFTLLRTCELHAAAEQPEFQAHTCVTHQRVQMTHAGGKALLFQEALKSEKFSNSESLSKT